MPSTPKPTTVAKYLAALPKERREALRAVRQVIRDNLDSGYEEGLQYGVLAYFVPHSVYPAGYHCDAAQPLPYIGLASQKSYMALYLFCAYTSEEQQRWFREAWAKTGKKLDMGKSCVRFRKLDDLPLDVIGKLVKRTPAKKFIAHYEAALGERRRPTKKTTAKKKTAKKKITKKKTTARKTAATARKKSTGKSRG